MASVTDRAVLRLKRGAVLDIVNVWVKENFVPGARATSIESSVDGEEIQIVVETELRETVPKED